MIIYSLQNYGVRLFDYVLQNKAMNFKLMVCAQVIIDHNAEIHCISKPPLQIDLLCGAFSSSA